MGDRADRKSTTGVLLQLDGVSLPWSTAKKRAVALSTTTAKFCALIKGAKLVVWMRRMLHELDYTQIDSTPVMEEIQVASAWSSDGVRHAKHVSIRYTFVKEKVHHGDIKLVYCSTEKMTADILTKALSCINVERHRCGLSLGDVRSE